MRSPACLGARPDPTWSPRRSAGTGGSRRCTGSATSPSVRTCPRSAPATAPRRWPPCATSPSAATAWPATPTSPTPAAAPPDTRIAPSLYSHNSKINYAGALGDELPDRITDHLDVDRDPRTAGAHRVHDDHSRVEPPDTGIGRGGGPI